MKKIPSKMNFKIKNISSGIPAEYATFLKTVKDRIRAAQLRAMFAVNSEMIGLYWDIGQFVARAQIREGWGASVIPRLSKDIANDFPELKGFSERNIGRMIAFYQEYPQLFPILPLAVAKLSHLTEGDVILPPVVAKMNEKDSSLALRKLVLQTQWAHNVLLIEKVKEIDMRIWYMRQVIENGWSRDMLALQIDSSAHQRRGKSINNFERTLPPVQSDLARQSLKDPYIFDFLTIAEPYRERELELALLGHVEKFLLELGQGFAFVGRQFHLDIGEKDFYLDLLFYHLKLRSFIVIDLKKGPFKPEHAGKMNFYCNVVDDRLRHPEDRPTIGLILCQDKNHVVAEYALKGVDKAIGVSEYQITRALPKNLQSSLPTVQEMEAHLDKLTVREKSILRKGKGA